jgi:phage terminase small subunit
MGSPKTLTHKQKAFAESVAKGKSKTEAYRSAYDTNTTAQAQRVEAHRLSMNPNIALMIESMKVSLEAQKYLLPAHLRALTIQKLTEKALDPDVNHAQQIKALELLGKITEVALFSERKEIITTDTSATAKNRLIASLAQAIRSSAHISIDKKQEADDLLAEITGGSLANPEPDTVDQAPEDINGHDDKAEGYLFSAPEAVDIEEGFTPPDPTPQNFYEFGATPTHTIPDKQSALVSETPPLSNQNTEGEGVYNFWDDAENIDQETPPLVNSGSHPIDISNPNWREV